MSAAIGSGRLTSTRDGVGNDMLQLRRCRGRSLATSAVNGAESKVHDLACGQMRELVHMTPAGLAYCALMQANAAKDGKMPFVSQLLSLEEKTGYGILQVASH